MDDLKRESAAKILNPGRSISGISIVIPAFNEEEGITDTIGRCQKFLASLPGAPTHEIIVVNDGSTDRTGQILQSLEVKVFRHLQNLGYGKSLKDGIAAACNDTILITDADGTYPIEEVPNLLKSFTLGYHLVIGRRQGKNFRQSWFKQPMRYMLQWIVEFVVGRKIPDVNSGLRIFSRAEIAPYLNHLCDTFSFTTSQTLAYFLTCKSIVFLPISYDERKGKTKVKLLRDSLRTMQYIIQAIVYYNPLKIFILMSLTCVVTGAAGILFTVITGVKAGYFVGLGALVCSIIVFSMGLLAEQLRQSRI
jgi:polyisoprenyl-phosphate glycosyltransferase